MNLINRQDFYIALLGVFQVIIFQEIITLLGQLLYMVNQGNILIDLSVAFLAITSFLIFWNLSGLVKAIRGDDLQEENMAEVVVVARRSVLVLISMILASALLQIPV
jgi:hypothetical protein